MTRPIIKKVLVKTEQKEEVLLDKIQRVHSQTNENGNKTTVFFTLPANQVTSNSTTRVVSWAYWVGVGEEANNSWKQNYQVISNIVKGGASYFTTPLGAYAVGAVADLMKPTIGEDVYYAVSDEYNKNLFMGSGQQYRIYDTGKGVAGYKKFIDPSICQGTYFVLLSNDNMMQGIDATVKVIAIVETNIYEDQPYIEKAVTPRTEKKTFSDPIVKTIKVPVMAE